jgi:hypothetical protein
MDIGFASPLSAASEPAANLIVWSKSSAGTGHVPDGIVTNVTEGLLDFRTDLAQLSAALFYATSHCLDATPTTILPFRRTPGHQPEVVIVPRSAMRAGRDSCCLVTRGGHIG